MLVTSNLVKSFSARFRGDQGGKITPEEYLVNIRQSAEALDSRVWVVAGSFLLTGTSIGIIVPCMPLIVPQLNIYTARFGLIVSSFAFSKLLGNIPSAYFVDSRDRQPMMVGGLKLCAIGIGGIGLSLLPGE